MKNIILTGFMGTGKSTVGRLLAEELQRPFVDIDSLIAAREGKEISEIFASRGEAYFRRVETSTLREILQKEGQVIATGGGALLQNRELLLSGGHLLCLTAPLAEILRRLENEGGRPLLKGSLEEKARGLLAERREIYQEVPWKIDTGGKAPRQVAEEILALLRQRGLTGK